MLHLPLLDLSLLHVPLLHLPLEYVQVARLLWLVFLQGQRLLKLVHDLSRKMLELRISTTTCTFQMDH